MALDENQNEIFGRNDRILEGSIVWFKKKIDNGRIDVPGLVQRIELNGLNDRVRVIYLDSQNLDKMHYFRSDELKLFLANDDRSKDRIIKLLSRNNVGAFKLWKSGVNIAKLLLKIRLVDRNTYFKEVLIATLQLQYRNLKLFMKRFNDLMNRRNLQTFKENDNIVDELAEVFTNELDLNRALNYTNPRHNHQVDEIAVMQIDRVCSKCLRIDNVTKCCTHCHRYFDETCFIDNNRNNNDPENLCPDCDTHNDVMENIAPSCETCKANLSQADADNSHKCIFHKCTVSYHSAGAQLQCFPAGAKKLSGTQMICAIHNDPKADSDQLKICRICCENKASIKCTLCPLSFHSKKCAKLQRNRQILCEMCAAGRTILEGDYIYAWNDVIKKWWPAQIISEQNLPEGVLTSRTMPERNRSGYFWIQFFETREFRWKHKSDIIILRQLNDDVIIAIRGKRKKDLFDKAISRIYI